MVKDWEDYCGLLGRWYVCGLHAGQMFARAGNGWPHNALRYHQFMPISCHFQDCKALQVLSVTYVSSAIASTQTFTFTFRGFLYCAVGFLHKMHYVKLCFIYLHS